MVHYPFDVSTLTGYFSTKSTGLRAGLRARVFCTWNKMWRCGQETNEYLAQIAREHNGRPLNRGMILEFVLVVNASGDCRAARCARPHNRAGARQYLSPGQASDKTRY